MLSAKVKGRNFLTSIDASRAICLHMQAAENSQTGLLRSLLFFQEVVMAAQMDQKEAIAANCRAPLPDSVWACPCFALVNSAGSIPVHRPLYPAAVISALAGVASQTAES